MQETYPFKLRPLPYDYSALEPHIDEETLHYHHDKHLKAYVDNLNHTLEPYPAYQNLTLKQLLANIARLPEAIRTPVKNNGGGVYNHNFYFETMTPGGSKPTGILKDRILADYGGLEQLHDALKQTALDRFGSGYAWLYLDEDGKLKITSTANQDTLLQMNVCPLLPVDVWEHAYYLKYKNLRGAYVDQWFQVIDWNHVAKRLENCLLDNN